MSTLTIQLSLGSACTLTFRLSQSSYYTSGKVAWLFPKSYMTESKAAENAALHEQYIKII
jgi:hypothetical protein